MKKITILLFIFMAILGEISLANPNIIGTPGWHNQQALYGQLEWDKKKKEEAIANSNLSTGPQADLGYNQFFIIIWNEDTGEYIQKYEWTKESQRSAIKNFRKNAEKQLGIKFYNDKYWNGSAPVIVMGLDRKTQKWVVWGDNDLAKWIVYVYGEKKDQEGNFIKYMEDNLLKKCSETSDYCQVVMSYPPEKYYFISD